MAGDEAVENELGSAKIPLRGLLLDENRINDRYQITNAGGDHIGLLAIEISMSDLLESNIHA